MVDIFVIVCIGSCPNDKFECMHAGANILSKWHISISVNANRYRKIAPVLLALRLLTAKQYQAAPSHDGTSVGTVICVSRLTTIGLDNGLSPERRQTIITTNDGILSIGPLETNFSEIVIKIYTFSFTKMHLKMWSGSWRPFCLRLNVVCATSTWWVEMLYSMMTSSNGNSFRVTGHFCGEFTGHRWIPHTKASDAELWCLLWSASE